MNTAMDAHPVTLVVQDDYHRDRVNVFFRFFAAIPHFIWYLIWTIFVVIVALIGWVIALFTGRLPRGMHRLLCSYIRYQAHFTAYFWLIGNPYPDFAGGPGSYPVDVVLPSEPVRQSRWTILFRLILAIPAFIVGGPLGGLSFSAPASRSKKGGAARYVGNIGLLALCGTFGWFASLARGSMPKGLRDAGAYAVGYQAQLSAYTLLVTDRYPNADPTEMLVNVTDRPPRHPIRVVGDPDDLRRSRLTTFFRLLLSFPHILWLVLWGIAAMIAGIAQWLVTLVRGRPAGGLHRFLTRYVRYRLHVTAYLFLVANPFPGFAGDAGTYPLDLEVADPEPQNRWKTLFRLVLALPAVVIDATLGAALFATALLTWFYALARGSAPWGLRNLAAYAVRYDAQVQGYLYLLTDRYPHASPLEGEDAPVPDALAE